MNDIGLRSQARSYSVRLCVSSIHFLCWCFTLCAMFSLKPCLEKNYLAPGFKALRAARCPLAPFQPEVCQRFPSKTKVTWWTRLPPKNPTSGCIYSTAHAQARNVNSNCIRYILTRRLWSSKWKALLFETTLKKNETTGFILTFCSMGSLLHLGEKKYPTPQTWYEKFNYSP